MTCIVAVCDGDRVWMGGDACAARDSLVFTESRPKVRRVDLWCGGTARHEPLLWASAGLSAVGQVLEDARLSWPSPADTYEPLPHADGADYYAHALSKFIRESLDAAGMVDKAGIPKTADGACMLLVAWRHRLWAVAADFYVAEVEHYAAIGSGEDVALGALHACSQFVLPGNGVVAVRVALEAAAAHTAYVRPPFFITSTREP